MSEQGSIYDLYADAVKAHIEARKAAKAIRPNIPRECGRIVMALLILIPVGFLFGWIWAFIGMTATALWSLAVLNRKARGNA